MKKLAKVCRNVLEKHMVRCKLNVIIGKDNVGCVQDMFIQIVRDVSKHVNVKHQFLFESVQKRSVGQLCAKRGMVADILTKNLKRVKFPHFCKSGKYGMMGHFCRGGV